ncbi:hypothetical protein NLU13_9157 [Sarocladium strictum]|uniref:Myb-like domain-containing protein n=1 Tax=Sarocladium strictum TaxID=5046 RepID=A0AA39GB09_SARSR|nr:hypothetical protein NLU13_9157 [Sarocladium strictum]
MLLPSALSCDASQPSHFLRSAAVLASPPASPPNTTGPLGNIVSTCRSLQSLISAPPNTSMIPAALPMPTMNELPTPPMTHSMPLLKLRLRSRSGQESPSESHTISRRRIVKRAPPRGMNKRRRDIDDDMGRDDVAHPFSDSEDDSDLEPSYTFDNVRPLPINFRTQMPSSTTSQALPPRPSTPKQSAIAPLELPLGLERSDFHENHNEDPDDATRAGTGIEIARDGEAWSVEQDRKLVEVIIARFKLTPQDMEDCARSLGRGPGCVERRWKSLVMNGDVVLKKRERRTRLHSTWGR